MQQGDKMQTKRVKSSKCACTKYWSFDEVNHVVVQNDHVVVQHLRPGLALCQFKKSINVDVCAYIVLYINHSAIRKINNDLFHSLCTNIISPLAEITTTSRNIE